MKDRLNQFKDKLQVALNNLKNLETEAKEIRSYYKYTEETDDTSESFIVNFVNQHYDDCLDSLQELIDYEEELENE